MATYCIDTSALIAAWYERYKPNRFPKLWAQFDALIDAQRLMSSAMVLDECSRRSPELHEWLKDRAAMFVPHRQHLYGSRDAREGKIRR